MPKKLPIKMWWLTIPVLTTLNQTCIKLLAIHMGNDVAGFAWLYKFAQSPLALAILLLEILTFLIWMKILADVPVSKAVPLTAVSYFSILLLSWFVFDEKILSLQVIGSILILTGVWLIATAEVRS